MTRTSSSTSQRGQLKFRPRRLRRHPGIRQMVRQIELSPGDLIMPLFVAEGSDIRSEIPSMPGQFQLSLDHLVDEAKTVADLGIPAVMLFGIPQEKDEIGSQAFASNGVIQEAVRKLKRQVPELVVITDVCLCEYTDHGHCGLINRPGAEHYRSELPDDYVTNDPTLAVLERIAISHAESGADIVAPSGMMDGMVAAIRESLDRNKFEDTAIMSYSVKYASAFYGPFRDAADGAPQFGDRNSHQMDFREKRQALLEARLDIEEGTDFLMVKPAIAYLDVIYQLNDAFPEMPLAAYHVSGEYAMIKAAVAQGWLDEKNVVLESLTGIKRAGADLILTYYAKDVCRWLK